MTEDEQLEVIKAWWKKHQNKVVIVLSIVLLTVAGFRYWNWHIEKRDQSASIVYEQLMHAFEKEDSTSIQAYAKTLTSSYQHTVYADAAMLVLARLYVTQQQWDKAIESLEQVANKGKTQALRQIAQQRQARLERYKKAGSDSGALKPSEQQATLSQG